MGYTLKTKSHKGQESRTRSQGPGAIDQEPRTKSQAYTMHGAKQNDFAQQAFAMHKHLCNLFPVTASGTKVKALCLTGSADLRARQSSGTLAERELAQRHNKKICSRAEYDYNVQEPARQITYRFKSEYDYNVQEPAVAKRIMRALAPLRVAPLNFPPRRENTL